MCLVNYTFSATSKGTNVPRWGVTDARRDKSEGATHTDGLWEFTAHSQIWDGEKEHCSNSVTDLMFSTSHIDSLLIRTVLIWDSTQDLKGELWFYTLKCAGEHYRICGKKSSTKEGGHLSLRRLGAIITRRNDVYESIRCGQARNRRRWFSWSVKLDMNPLKNNGSMTDIYEKYDSRQLTLCIGCSRQSKGVSLSQAALRAVLVSSYATTFKVRQQL